MVRSSRPRRGKRRGGLDHRVGAVGDDDRSLRAGAAPFDDARPAGVVHVQAVDHHHGLDRDVEPRSPEPQHLADVGVAEEQPAGQLVVLLVERAAGDQDGERFSHGKYDVRAIAAMPRARNAIRASILSDRRVLLPLRFQLPASSDQRPAPSSQLPGPYLRPHLHLLLQLHVSSPLTPSSELRGSARCAAAACQDRGSSSELLGLPAGPASALGAAAPQHVTRRRA